MRTLIVGVGEIGKSLSNVLSGEHSCGYYDSAWGIKIPSEKYEMMHICFPYSDGFVKLVKEYQRKFEPIYTVIHATVPVGTSRKCNAMHSAVIGIHPHLERSLRTFTKFIGGEQASEVADYFRRAGMKVSVVDKSEYTELMKILDTTFYGVCLEYTKDVKRQCQKFGVPFELWTVWTENYNRGYQSLGFPEFTRPNLTPIMKTIGGHCVRQNAELLETKFTKLIRESNG